MKVLKILAAAVIALSLAACEGSGQKQTGGTILGAIAGAAIGSQIGSGAGQAVAIGVGALIGGVIGNEIGRRLDEQDRQYAQKAAAQAVVSTPTGTTSTWTNPDSGNSGTYRPVDEAFQNEKGRTCRKVQTSYTIDGKTVNGEETMCQNPDGTVVTG